MSQILPIIHKIGLCLIKMRDLTTNIQGNIGQPDLGFQIPITQTIHLIIRIKTQIIDQIIPIRITIEILLPGIGLEQMNKDIIVGIVQIQISVLTVTKEGIREEIVWLVSIVKYLAIE